MSARGDSPAVRIGAWAEARAAVLLDEYELIDEGTDEQKLNRFLLKLRKTVTSEASDRIEEHDRLRDEGR